MGESNSSSTHTFKESMVEKFSPRLEPRFTKGKVIVRPQTEQLIKQGNGTILDEEECKKTEKDHMIIIDGIYRHCKTKEVRQYPNIQPNFINSVEKKIYVTK